MAYKDPERRKAHIRADYRKNRAKRLAQVRARERETLAWVRSQKTKCARCPETHIACLDFHHRDGTKKEMSIGKAKVRGWSKERLAREIAKCEVLCANCHRKEHWEERHAHVAQLDNAPGYEPGDFAGSTPAGSTNADVV